MNNNEELIKKYNDEAIKITNGEYEVLDKIRIESKTGKSYRYVFQFKHNACGRVFNMTKHNFFISGYRCSDCSKTRPNITDDKFKKIVEDLVGDEYSVIDEYKNAYTKIKFKHNICGREFYMAPKHFVHDGNRCRLCLNESMMMKDYPERIKMMSNGTISVIDKYNGRLKTLKHQCNLCGNYFYNTPANILEQYKVKKYIRCLNCDDKRSKGEYMINSILLENYDLPFVREYRTPECRDKNMLPFDFCIFDKDNKILCIIEFDGPQHKDQKSKYAINGKFEIIKKHDNIKNEYCLSHNIPLLRIDNIYDKDVIFDIIEKFFKENNISSTTIENNNKYNSNKNRE